MPDISNARVLVIGGAGFVGSHLVDQLTEEPVREIVVLDNFARGRAENLARALEDDRVALVEGSILDRARLAEVMADTDYVFHLAALWLWECVNDPRSAIDVNAVGTFNVLEAAQQAGVRKVVYSSSASVYGDAVASPMTESHPFNNRTMYGATKIASEQFCRAMYEQHGLDYVGLRYMNLYGPRMDYKGAYVSVIMKVLDKIEAGEAPVIFGDGSQAYDFIHVHDGARANILALKSDVTDEFFNVGTGVRTTIKELVDELLVITGSALEPDFRPEEQMFVTERVGSTALASERLGFSATTGYRDGLRSVVEWRQQDRLGVAGETSPSAGH
jgi:UDP-glucose 4-epimerase